MQAWKTTLQQYECFGVVVFVLCFSIFLPAEKLKDTECTPAWKCVTAGGGWGVGGSLFSLC